MRPARFGSLLLVAAIVSITAWDGMHAQEASAEITAIATIIPPPVEISSGDLNFGSLQPGEEVNIEGELWNWSEEDRWPGHATVENIVGLGVFTVTLTKSDLIHATDPTQSIPLVWDGLHAAVCLERLSGRGGQFEAGCQSWEPVSGEPYQVASAPQGAPTAWTINAELYIGGRIVWEDQRPGTYEGTIEYEIGFPDQ